MHLLDLFLSRMETIELLLASVVPLVLINIHQAHQQLHGLLQLIQFQLAMNKWIEKQS